MPTPKQEKLAKALVANAVAAKPVGLGVIMESNGYAPNTAKTPQQIISGAGVQEALAIEQTAMTQAMEDKGLDVHFLADKVRGLLNKQEIVTRNNNKTGEVEVIPTGQLETAAVSKGLDFAFKIRGDYKADRQHNPGTVNINILNSPAVQGRIKAFEEDLAKLLTTPPV